MRDNFNLRKAKEVKNDEFYTLLEDIDKEIPLYKDYLKDKRIYLPCDNAEWSNFWLFFTTHFEEYGLKSLTATCYNRDGKGKWWEYDGSKVEKHILKGDGDFRSDECIDILKTADIMITNPPFSLFRDFVKVMMENEKVFLVIGNQNAITYRSIFPLLRDRIIWLGQNEPKKFWNGDEVKSINNCLWFTNLADIREPKPLLLEKRYDPEIHKRYDNYDAINADKIKDIPYDYRGVIGVPITIFKYWDLNGIEIIGAARHEKDINGEYKSPYIDGKEKYQRVFIKIIGITEANIKDGSAGLWEGGELKSQIDGKNKYARVFIKV